MLFITNRVLNEGTTPIRDNVAALPRSISFNFSNNQAEQSVYFCRRNSKDSYTEIGSQALLTELKNANTREILLYIHGFSNLPEAAIFPKAQELQRLFDQKALNYMLVVPLIWPCDNNMGMVKDYFNDQITADASAFAFARLMQKFLEWRVNNSNLQIPCTKRINILAHSMGNRVLRGTLSQVVHYYQPGGVPFLFRNVFMAAADVVNNALEPGQEGQYIPQAARNVVVYYAADDLALRASKVANLRNSVASRRLGHTGPENLDNVANNVYAVDCADFNEAYDRPIGHGYFASNPQGNPGLLFNHLWQCIKTGRVPMKSANSRTTILDRDFW
jgi:esterase/lipase superfamily enzyme